MVRFLHLFQSTVGCTTRHDEFHRLRDRLRDEGVHGPSGEPLPLPPVGNWVLGLGVCLLGIESEPGQELFARISNHATASDLVETWSLSFWLQGHRSLGERLSAFFLQVHEAVQDLPRPLLE